MVKLISIDIAIEHLQKFHKDYSSNNFESAKETYDIDFDHYSGDYDLCEYIPFTPEYEILYNELYRFIELTAGIDSRELDDLVTIDLTIPNNITEKTNNAFKYLKQYLNKLKAEKDIC